MIDLLRALTHHASTLGGLAVDHPHVRWTWPDLLEEVRAAVEAQTVHEPGTRVLVNGSARALVPAVLAAASSRVCVVPMPPGLADAERTRRAGEATRGRGPEGGVLVFTSGTTSRPRAVRLSIEALLASAERVTSRLDLRPGDTWLSSLPLAHVGGLGVVLRCALAGATMLLDDRFSAGRTAEALPRATHASFVARMLERTLDALDAEAALQLRTVMVGGGPSAAALLHRARARGLPVVTTWGLSEAGSTVTVHEPGACPDPDGSAGWPLPGVDVRIAEPGQDGAGPIEVRGPTLMEGYDDATEPQSSDGWLRTGDIGRLLPDGRLCVLDRRRDLIVSGGENVAPSRVEAVFAAHPDVDEVAVVGLPDASWGQRVVAAVRLHRPSPELGDALGAQLTPAERPRQIVEWPEPLPRNAAGKLLRDRVRDALLGGLALLTLLLSGCAHNTASRDAGALEARGAVVYRAGATIHASPEVVFSVVADLDAYADWNPWITAARGVPEPGESVDVDLVLGGRQRVGLHTILEVERPSRFCWRDRGWTTAFAYGQRCRTFERLPDGGTAFHVELLISGPFTRTVERRFGAELRERLEEETAALAQRAEALAPLPPDAASATPRPPRP